MTTCGRMRLYWVSFFLTLISNLAKGDSTMNCGRTPFLGHRVRARPPTADDGLARLRKYGARRSNRARRPAPAPRPTGSPPGARCGDYGQPLPLYSSNSSKELIRKSLFMSLQNL
ncbi:hypothetical protein EVAR_11163_1 [Eumeta japonica]|uniref:Secreted protein n=1 Tax=Eumeta variegata TaxID=151549 RepID=A0A4C1U480_EUMVA|nr:hypothetical protein EVAR_11163_1 [Eumeta japonica]